MARILQSLARASLNRSSPLAAAAALLALSLFPVPCSLLAADFSGSVTMPGGAKIEFQNVAATNWVGGELVLKYTTTTGSHGFTLPGPAIADVLVVGGGGAGGSGLDSGSVAAKAQKGVGGGGGAGGLIETNDMVLAMGTYSVAVGKGGQPGEDASGSPGGDGDDSTIVLNSADVFRAYGGGGGGAESDGSGTIEGGKKRGSGGGGSREYTSSSANSPHEGGKGFSGQGSAGGPGTAQTTAGGGGGAGGEGGKGNTANVGGAGGLGKASTIWNGTEILYAAGGGGGSRTGTGGTGGSSIGGNGGGGTSGTGTPATPGAINTGSGGGGGTLTKAGGAGGSGVVIVRISAAMAGPVVKPTNVTTNYDGEVHLLVKETMAYTVWQNGKSVDKVEAKAAGTYPATVKLNPGFEWSTGGDDDVEVTLKIDQAKTRITNLSMPSWTEKDPPLPEPTCTINVPGVNAEFAYAERDWGLGIGDQGLVWTKVKPTVPGDYWIKALVLETANWTSAEATAAFSIYEKPANIFEDHVEIKLDPYEPQAGDPAELTNFPYKVTLSATNPTGFDYTRADALGHELCFADKDGNALSYEVEGQWNPGGESVLYVLIPRIKSGESVTLTLYWKVRDGKTAPAYDPTHVFDDWTKDRADNLPGRPGSSFGMVETNGQKVDYWVKEPEIKPTSWGVTEDPSKTGYVVTNGALKSGREITYAVYDAETGLVLDPPRQMPMTEGVYYVLFSNKTATAGYRDPAPQRIDIRVIARAPYDEKDLKDGAATVTLGGRVMLANGEKKAGHEIGAEEGQAYWQIRRVRDPVTLRWLNKNPYWTHEGDYVFDALLLPYLLPNGNHDLSYIDAQNKTNVIWRFRDIRIGNTYRGTAGSKVDGMCYLPHSTTGLGITDVAYSTTQGLIKEIGHLVMRNLRGAAVYSKCYTNGIGTIYFDAVNAYTQDAAAGKYKLAVEIATATTDGKEPTDENAGENLEYLAWTRCDVTVLRCVDGAFATDVTVTNEVTLANLTSATDNNFYRLCAKLNKPGKIRFRIVRTEAVPTDQCGADAGRFILLDNIIASLPTDEASAEPFGVERTDLGGKQTLGWEGVLTTPHPFAAADALYARAKAVTNATSVSGYDPSTFIQLSKFHYQWHYLGQASNEEQSVDLRLQDGLVATQPLNLPKETGDVSFWLETYTKIPFYDYVDYSGTDLNLGMDEKGEPLYTEEVGTKYFPADARDGGRCFFRLREGESDWDVISVSLSGSGFGFDTPMELIGDHMWRGLVKMPTNVQGLVNFEFQGAHRWEAGGTEPAETGVVWYPTAAVTNHLPARGQAAVTGAPKPFRADGATSYMEFQFNDETKMFSLGHAEYQNFNVWHDARTTNETFVGTYVETSGVSVASMVSTNAHMATWETLRVTDDNWDEDFYLSNYETDAYRKNVTFATHKMPHQWNGENGMFVDAELTGTGAQDRQRNSGLAWQMQGFGLGSMSFTQTDVPNGLDTVIFSARLQQGISFEDFSYCYADGMMATNNYTFVIPAILSTSSSDGLGQDFAPGASMSIIGYYQPFVGCYEFRVSRDDSANLRFTVYKWARKGYRFVGTPIGTHLFNKAAFWHANGTSKAKLYGMFISIGEEAGGKTSIIAGLTQSADAPTASYAGSGYPYRALRCEDASSPFKAGSIGVLTTSCKGRFMLARRYPGYLKSGNLSGTASTPDEADKKFIRDAGGDDTVMKNYYGSVTFSSFPGTFNETSDRKAMSDFWAQTPGRIEWFEETSYGLTPPLCGFRPPVDLNQTVDLYLKASNTGSASSEDAAWQKWPRQLVVSSYGWQTWGITVRTNQSCHVMLKPGDAPADVTIGYVSQSGWNGADMANPPDNDFIFTQAKVSTNMVLTVGEKTVTNRYCTLQPARAQPTKPLSIRAPILRHGLGMVGFKFTNLWEGCEVWVQTSTNEVTSRISGSRGLNQSLLEGAGPGEWETKRKYTYEELAAAGGEVQHSFGLHDVLGHPVVGVIRILIAPHVVEEAAGVTLTNPNYGAITITDIWVEDEPALDTTSWLGWNLRILGDAKDTERRMYLPDPNTDVQGRTGLSSALNNSTTDGIPEGKDPSEYSHINPTIQSPTFKAGSIGYVRFRARVYDNSGIVGQPAKVTLYGTMDSAQDAWGEPLETFDVDSLRFKEFNYRAGASRFAAIRLVVDGVVTNGTATGKTAVRVLLDEVIVSEKAESTIGFEYARPFRSDLDTDEPIEEAKVLGMSEQPLAGESWGVQTKLKIDQFDEDIDLSRGLRVTLRTYKGATPWGARNWGGLAGEEADLTRMAAPDDLVFRSTSGNPRSIIAATREPNTVVQYELKVHYYIKGEAEEQSKPIEVTDTVGEGWTNPTWYWPEDKNADKPADDRVPYTILDGLSPGRAWINEVNFNDGRPDETGGERCLTNQFIEIAVPWDVDMRNWQVRIVDYEMKKATIATFGLNGVPVKKAKGEHSGDYGFLVLESPETQKAGGIRDWKTGEKAADAKWMPESLSGTLDAGSLRYSQPYQIELVRPSGIVEHQFVVQGTNEWWALGYPDIAANYEGTNLVKKLNAWEPSPLRFYAGEDVSRKPDRTKFASFGVTGPAHGEEGGWSSAMKFTPGRLNEDQDELSGWFLRPNGDTIWVYARVEEASRGNVVQHAGSDDSQDTHILVSSGGSTNITYDVSPWFAARVTAVTEAGRTNKAALVTGQGGTFSLNNVTETLYVVAREDFDPRLAQAGLDPDDRYAKAVQRWMRDRSRADAEDRFKNPDGPITNAIYRGLEAGATNCVIGLKGMYWFDIDPTEGGWWLRGGFVDIGLKPRTRVFNPGSKQPYSNPQIGVKLYWSNEVSKVVYAPYRLQGLNNEKSDEVGSYSSWTSETFKVEAILMNGMEHNVGYVPFRWFVFGPDSFVKPTDAAAGRPAYSTKIELFDPFSFESPGYDYGWRDYKGDAILLRWNINDLMPPTDAEMLQADSTYDGDDRFE